MTHPGSNHQGDDPTLSPGDAPTQPIGPNAPVVPVPARAADTPPTAPGRAMPSAIGPYRLVRVLGEGGMGTVYEAEQDSPRRAVALKVIRAGYLSEEHLRRFKQESQVLGRLQHPGIAQVYEAGMATDAQGHSAPFFAMEFIKGVPLTDYAAARELGTRDRLDLLAKVCDAVYHAHQKGVIHRDLKPGNILVDESGQPKILDFGVARATDSDVQQTTMRTDIGQLIGTIPYMSPEQVGGDPGEMDTRSDVYALGVVAYELLAGRMPYDLRRKMIHEAARVIREDEPTRLSSINRSLRGDVETIVAKSLEKDKTRRYQSAESLASDIRRYLKDEPIAARPANTWYQFRKFSQRNTGLVGGAALALVLLVVGIVATSFALKRALTAESGLSAQLAETQTQRAEAVKQKGVAVDNAIKEAKARARAEAINTFVTKALQAGDPFASGTRETTIAEAMHNAATEIEAGAFKGEPATEAGLQDTIATILLNNGKLTEAQPLFTRALATREKLLSPDHPDVADSLNSLADLYRTQGKYDEAEPLFTRALAIREKAFGPDHPDVATTLNNQAELYSEQSQYALAEPLFTRALAIREKALGPDHHDVAKTVNNMAVLYLDQGRYSLAEPFFTRALAISEKALGPNHPWVATSLNNLAQLYLTQGQYALAEPLYTRALAIDEKALGNDHPDVATDLNNLAWLHNAQGQYALAEPLFTRALAIREKSFGPDHANVAAILNNLAGMYHKQRQYDLAEPLYARALVIWEKTLGPDHPNVAALLGSLATLYRKTDRVKEAEPLYVRALAIEEKALGEDHPNVASDLYSLADLYNTQGRYAEAEPLYARALVIWEKTLGPDHPSVATVLRGLATLYRKTDRAKEAEPLETRANAIRDLKR